MCPFVDAQKMSKMSPINRLAKLRAIMTRVIYTMAEQLYPLAADHTGAFFPCPAVGIINEQPSVVSEEVKREKVLERIDSFKLCEEANEPNSVGEVISIDFSTDEE